MTDGVARLIAGESAILPNSLHVGSHIKQISREHTFPPTYTSSELSCDLNPAYNIYKGFFLDSSLDVDIIDKITMRFTSNGQVDYVNEISGFAIRIFQKLSGSSQIPYGMIPLPFPQIDMERLYYDRVTVTVNCKNPMYILDNIKREIEKHVYESLVDIICAYAIGDISVSLWARCITETGEACDKKRLDQDPHRFHIVQCQEDIRNIKIMESDVSFRSRFTHLLHKVTMVFFRTDDIFQTPLDILIHGTLDIAGSPAFEFTRRSALIFDKVSAGAHVPDEPIYTLTFDNQPLNLDSNRAHSRVNFAYSINPSFRFSIIPQLFPVSIRLIGENINMIMMVHGTACVRFCK